MFFRTLLLTTLALSLTTLAAAPATAVVVPQTCTASVGVWEGGFACGGTVTGSASARWCPFDNNPNIQCIDTTLVTCIVSTTTPSFCVLLP